MDFERVLLWTYIGLLWTYFEKLEWNSARFLEKELEYLNAVIISVFILHMERLKLMCLRVQNISNDSYCYYIQGILTNFIQIMTEYTVCVNDALIFLCCWVIYRKTMIDFKLCELSVKLFLISRYIKLWYI